MAGAVRGTILTTGSLAKNTDGAARSDERSGETRCLIGPLPSYKSQDNRSLQRSDRRAPDPSTFTAPAPAAPKARALPGYATPRRLNVDTAQYSTFCRR